MAVRTSSQAGNTNSAPFAFGSAINAGDQLVIGHAVAVDANVTLGISPPSTPDGSSAFRPTVAAGTGGTLTSLPTGNYLVVYTQVDALGGESSRSPESSTLAITNGVSKPRVTLPALPTGVSSYNLYLTNTGGAALSEHRYATGITGTTYDLVSASWENGTLSYASAVSFPDSSAATVNGTAGSLTVNAGVTLTCRGDVRSSNGNVTLAAGASLAFDSSAASSPSNTQYALLLGLANGQTSAKLTANGTAGSPCTVSGGRGAVAYSAGTGGLVTNGGNYSCTYTTFSAMGSATVSGLDIAGQNGTACVCSFDHCTFDGCGQVKMNYSYPTGAAWSFTSCTFKNGLNTTTLLTTSATSPTAGRTLTGNYFDQKIQFVRDGLTATNNVFMLGYTFGSGGNTRWTSFDGNLVRQASGGTNQLSQGGTISNCYYLIDAAILNPHFLGVDTGLTGTVTLTTTVFEFTGTDHNGDCWLIDTNTGLTWTMTYCIVLPNGATSPAGGDNSGTLVTVKSTIPNTSAVVMEHNTYFTGSQSAAVNEQNVGNEPAGTVTSFRSNIAWCYAQTYTAGLGPYKITDSHWGASNVTSGTQDIVTAANADYNCGWNLLNSTTGGVGSYNLWFSGTPGVHDRDGNPGFVDSTRNFAKWAVSRGSASGTTAGQITDGYTYLQADPTLVSSSLLPYIRAGFAPTNSALHNTAHDGTDIGAVAWQSAGGSWPWFSDNDLAGTACHLGM